MPKPNIVFIMCDSMDGRAMGCMGQKAARTPNLDRLAAEGTLFTDAYTNNPICTTSRASMFSGLYNFHCKAWNLYKGLEPGDHTLFDALTGAGYDVRTYGKTDYLSGGHTVRARVSAWTSTASIMKPNYIPKAPVIDKGNNRECNKRDWGRLRDFLSGVEEQAASGKPFFSFIGFDAPHPNFRTNEYYRKLIDMEAIEIPPRDEAPLHPVMHYHNVVKNWRHGTDDAMVRKVRGVYYAMIAQLDEAVGEVLAKLEALGIAEDTYVIFTSDHGEMCMEHGTWYKSTHYEPSARVPLIVRGPGVAKGGVRGDLVSLIDMYPTVCGMIGAQGRGDADGLSLLPLLMGEKQRLDRACVFSEYHDSAINSSAFMLRRGNYKYIAYPGFAPMLFDLERDRWELRNLAKERPELAAELDALLRGICDYEKVFEEVVAYDKNAFRQWRESELAAGTYRETMNWIFSGFDYPREEAPTGAWTGEDEEAILRWMEP
ncbi:MAG: sulfatase-like hydrolase/transferase [Oscillospiraceae bacterium]|nr:sulfatase-like hydrolase/transferase [Oscillospiraceae bacterium]